jgi:phosphoribosylpyrophosphate synthetase
MITSPVKVFATSGSEPLTEKICLELSHRLPDQMQPQGKTILARHNTTWFSNQNIEVQIENVRGHSVVVVHTQAPPVPNGMIELFALLDAVVNAHPVLSLHALGKK